MTNSLRPLRGTLVAGATALMVMTACQGTEATPSPDESDAATAQASATVAEAPEAVFEDGDTITVISPYSAGGGYDVSTRLLVPCVESALEDELGIDLSVVVQNLTGASGQVGTSEVFSAEPDGRMLLMNAVDIMVPQEVVEEADFSVGEFVPLAQFVLNGRSMIIRSDVLPEDADFTDLIERSQETPVLIGGAGLQNQIALMQLLLEDGGTPIELSLVEFEGTTEGVASMLRGELEVYLVGTSSGIDVAEANPEIRVLTVFNDDDPLAGEVDAPTLSESGVPNAEQIAAVSASNVRAFFAPPGTDEATVAVLEEAFAAAMEGTECAADIEETGEPVVYGPPSAVEDAVRSITDIYEQYGDQLQ